ncbi:hypothetical protein CYMTET_29604 [Cymbomonas tetramitiformis]|uniref:Uncharacterized protein n=1 Tax=Cymbomonas tetramitiformis TaxID=36881 RepID=A0AAE0KUS4_9CHLO|nr:hypothetical protein CYMTET_29604 [Cymbomonas tetramitiformis]|eukprot:gene9780-11587_t
MPPMWELKLKKLQTGRRRDYGAAVEKDASTQTDIPAVTGDILRRHASCQFCVLMSTSTGNTERVKLWCEPDMRARLKGLIKLVDPAVKTPTKRVCKAKRAEICVWFAAQKEEVAKMPDEVASESAALVAGGLLEACATGGFASTG